MSDDFVGARAKIVALTATKNILFRHYGARDVMRVIREDLVEEIRRLSSEDMNTVSKAIDYAQDEIFTED